MFTVSGEIVAPDRVFTGCITVNDGGIIADVSAERTVSRMSDDLEFPGLLVAPGFIDMHVHGGGGADFMDHTNEAVRQVTRTHARFGTTTLLATTLTASRDEIDKSLAAIRSVQNSSRHPDEARIGGIHLEGPYVCRTRAGAQPHQFIRPPDIEELNHWIDISGLLIKEITLAPEIEGALELIRVARAAGIIVSMGHTNSTVEAAQAAVECGANQATHLFNAMRGLHHRQIGLVGLALTSANVVVEIIADGFHLDPAIIDIICRTKGPDGVVLITDAMSGTAMPDGAFELGGMPVNVSSGTASFADGTLAGSVLTMNRAFMNCVRFSNTAPQIVSRYASVNSARQLGIEANYGSIENGKVADIVAFSPATGEVECTIIDGTIAYRR